MSYVRLNILDNKKVLIGDIHGSMCDSLVASLTAEPETIEEMEVALERFVKFESDWKFFGRLRNYEFDEPLKFRYYTDLEKYDAGILIIDLGGRIIAVDSTYSTFSKEGTIAVRDELADESEDDFLLPYHLSDDWRFVYSIEEYEGIAKERREERLKNEPLDARKVLYGGALFKFLVNEMQSVEDLEKEGIFTDIHRKWLMTEREDLRGKTPREVIFEKKEFVNFDLHSRSLQWTFTKKCPPFLSADSNAYKFSGFGTHEWVIYYDLIRWLMENYYERLNENKVSDFDSEVKYLSDLADKWLKFPNLEFSGRKPLRIIQAERRRENMTVSSHEALIDEDCPCCVELSEMFDTPMFWHLDGHHMEDEFAFSYHTTLEEWEKHKKEMEEFNREFDKKMKQKESGETDIFDEEIIDENPF